MPVPDNDGVAYANLDALLSALKTSFGFAECGDAAAGDACLAGVDIIEDLAEFNLTYSIDLTQFAGSKFSLLLV